MAQHFLKALHVASLFTLGTLACSAWAAPGNIDMTFGARGTVVNAQTDARLGIEDVAIQPDGAIVGVGGLSDATQNGPLLVRYLPNGRLDNQFGNDGMVVTVPSSGYVATRRLALQRDGKIIVAGEAYVTGWGDQTLYLARYNPDGTLDSTFGQGGLVHSDTAMLVYDLAVQEDGRILMAGYFNDLLVARYLPDGSPDSSFGEQGIATVRSGNGSFGEAMAIQPDGSIVVVGEVLDEYLNYLIMATRLRPDGQLDMGFGNQGVAVIKVRRDSWHDTASDVLIQPDGGITLIGESPPSWTFFSNMVVVRLDAQGQLDSQFGINGMQLYTGLTDSTTVTSAVAQPDGRIFVAGSDGGQYNRMYGMRLDSQGHIDTAFSKDGRVIRQVGSWSQAFATAVQTNGRLVMAGNSFPVSAGPISELDIVLLRYLANDDDNDYVAEPWDLQPDVPTFPPVSAGSAGMDLVSDPSTVSGLGANVAVPIKIAGGEYAINDGPFTAHPGYVRNGDSLTVKAVSAGESVCVQATVSLGGMYADNSTYLVLGQESIVKASYRVNCPN